MTNKIIFNKVNLLLMMIMGSLFLFSSNYVMAATDYNQMEHKTNVVTNKVWKIKLNQPVNEDKLSNSVKVYSPIGEFVQTKISYDSINNTIIVAPPTAGYKGGQTYSLQIYQTLMDLNNSSLEAPTIMNFTIKVPDMGPRTNSYNRVYNYEKYDNTLEQMVDLQSRVSPLNVITNYTLNPSEIDISEFVNPKNFENHDYAVYQFLTLKYIEGITAEDLDIILIGKGILEGQGKIFLDACKEYNINPAYILAHAMLETGNGTSELSKGVTVNEVGGTQVEEKITYNMFGIGALSDNAVKLGSERAYKEKWFTVKDAIEGGIKYISTQYINNELYAQNTLYKMRWNPQNPATHQYASDIGWAYKQSYKIKDILDKCVNAQLVFEIPQYK